ncbi:TonB-dependent receptor [Aquimarina sp. AD10]|nr:TonB-dependent receptor [Aquimarina sp. AD10]RKM94589.1 TonB-dependent receptor [Aquimarina sp. AD10]
MIKIKVTTLFILLLFFLNQVYSQSDNIIVPLSIILDETQNKFDCNFTYLDKDVSGLRLKKPSDTLNLQKTIAYLRYNTPLNYTFLNDNTIVLSLTNNTQNVCGTLKSLYKDEILANASIQINDDLFISNAKGEFSIPVKNPNDYIKISFVGFKTLKILAKELLGTPCKTVQLIPEIQYLNEVVLNDYLVKGIARNPDGSIVIDYTDFGLLPGLIEPDLLQTIQALPGIISVEETVSDINVRGGTNDQNLILWDGIKMYQSGHFFGLISAFNPYLTKNVQLTKNGSSSSYGDGVSSVIAMNTTNEINQDFDAGLGINMISADGFIDTPIGKKSSLQLSARKSISEIAETPTYEQFFDKAFQDSEVVNSLNTDEKFSFYDTSLRWLYQFTPKDLIKVNGLIIRNDLGFQENAIINETNISRESTVKQNNSAASIMYERNWTDAFKSELLIYGTNYKLEAINSDIINNQRLQQENEVLESGIKLNTMVILNSNVHLKSGYQFNETGISNLRDVNNPTFRDLIKEVIRTNSIFSEIAFKSKNASTYLNIGARLNHFDKFGAFRLEPRIGFNHRFTNHLSLEFLGELKSQVTSQIIESQNDFLGIENKKWVLSNNDNIPILKSQQTSLGLSYKHNNWLISADSYYKKVDGIIAQSQGFQNQLEFADDHGNYIVKGVDFLINKRFAKFSTWLSYSYADNQYEFNQLSEQSFPNTIDITHNLNIALAYTNENLKISSGINWHSGKPTTRPIIDNPIDPQGNINYEHPNSDTLTDYFRWDVSATYNFKFSSKVSGNMGLSIWNILSQENIVNNYYRIDSENRVREIQERGLGFTPNAVLRINF